MSKLILIRGIPGSGKSTLAEKLAKEIEDCVIVEADDFFTLDGEYKFNFGLIKAAHQYCFGKAFYNLYRGKNVIVSNTFTQKWEIAPYVETAFMSNFEWEIVEPKTKWKSNPNECAEKNVHGLQEAIIQKMKDRWESTKDLMEYFEKQGWVKV